MQATIKLTWGTRLLKGPRLTGLPAGTARAAAAMWERCTVPVDDTGQDPIGEDVRLKSLDARLKAAADAEKIRTGTAPRNPNKGYQQGSRVLAELIGGPVGGGLLGWLLDRWFNTSPWLLLGLLILGFAAAIWNIVKISSQRPE